MPKQAEEFPTRIEKKNFDNLIEVKIVGWAIMALQLKSVFIYL